MQETGLKIIATICDQGTSNVAAINSLLKETRELYIEKVRNIKVDFLSWEIIKFSGTTLLQKFKVHHEQ